jgi:hypothetical protein
MKIKLSPSEESQVRQLFARKEMNMKAAEAINTYLDYEDVRSSKASSYLFYDKGENSRDSFNKVFRKLSKADDSLIKDYQMDQAQEIDPTPFQEDPYYKLIHFHDETLGEWKLHNNAYRPFEGFVCNELVILPRENYKEITPLGYFKRPFPFLEVTQKGVTWMSLTPHEINTMREDVKKASGKVLTFGLGLGYYALLTSLKDDVSSVDVVELDSSIITLFKQYILPQFPHPEKIHIIQEDAFKFASKLKDEEYNYLFDDIWHLPTDGLYLYLQMKDILKGKMKKTIVSSWVETSLLTLLRRAVLILLEEEMNGSEEIDYSFASSSSDLLINSLHKKLKKKEITSYLDVISLLSDDSLKAL